ncbi:MAG TPA: ABC transporter permease [Candidatus Angelobacter sp.]|nr:ABC transporter permease [Candidatus Angelobacter sp.]
MNSLFRDIKFSFRKLVKTPVFTAAAILTLALGIGANSAIFSVVDAVLFRSLPVPEPDKLVALGLSIKNIPQVVSYPDLRDMREQADRYVDLFGYRIGTDGLSDGTRADQIITSYVTSTYFTALGVKPALGRMFVPVDNDLQGPDPTVILSYTYWKSHFGGDPSVVGKVVRVNGSPVTIVGVAPEGFRGALTWMNVQAYLPLSMSDIDVKLPLLDRVTGRALFVLGRLRPGASLAQARSVLGVVADRLAQEHPKEDEGAKIFLLSATDAALNPVPQPGQHERIVSIAGLFLILALLVLTLACLNLGNLVLVRATARRQEMAIRAALGAGRWTLLRQTMTETLLLTSVGCIAGLVVGYWGASVLQSIRIDIGLPVVFKFGIDGRVFAYAAGASVFAALLVGFVPAVRASLADPSDALRDRARTATLGKNRLRAVLVLAQISVSLLLLIVAGLFTHSLFAVQRMNLGFNPDNVLKLALDPHGAGFNMAQERQLYADILHRVSSLPGVHSATLSFTYPSQAITQFRGTYVESRPIPAGQLPPETLWSPVSAGYFETLEIPILRGRSFRDSDSAEAPPVAVINQTMARQFWSAKDPIGESISISGPSGPWIQVVGVAQDSTYYSVFARNISCLYLPFAQQNVPLANVLVKTSLEPELMTREVENEIHAIAPDLPIFGAGSLQKSVNNSLGGFYAFRLGAGLTTALGILGFVLAVIGVYGVIAYSMSRRTNEIGIRMALGGRPNDILRMVFRQGVKLVSAGTLIGILLALMLSRALSHVLFGVRTYDPVTYIGVTALVAAITLLACYIPARHAAHIDPSEALRDE